MQALTIGFCTLDQIGVVDRIAENGAQVEMPTFSTQGGGAAATAAVALARWGVATRFIGKVADDERGHRIERTLSNEGVNTELMIKEAGKVSQLSFTLIEGRTGQSQSYFTRGNISSLMPGDFELSVVDHHDLLVVDGHYPEAQLEAMKRAREQGIATLLQGQSGRSGCMRCVELADVVVASERDASALTGVGSLEGICRAFLERGAKSAIITLGDEGAVAMGEDGRLIRVDAVEVKVVDRIGAGDVFLGAVGLGVLEGWSLEKLLRFANAAASLSCGGLGSRSRITDRATLEGMI